MSSLDYSRVANYLMNVTVHSKIRKSINFTDKTTIFQPIPVL
jgi:hypothetical protein